MTKFSILQINMRSDRSKRFRYTNPWCRLTLIVTPAFLIAIGFFPFAIVYRVVTGNDHPATLLFLPCLTLLGWVIWRDFYPVAFQSIEVVGDTVLARLGPGRTFSCKLDEVERVEEKPDFGAHEARFKVICASGSFGFTKQLSGWQDLMRIMNEAAARERTDSVVNRP